MVTKSGYGEREVEAAKAVLLEVTRVLGKYREQFVLIGGSLPPVLFHDAEEPHIGSLDIDLLFDYKNITDEAYGQIRDLLISRGYSEKERHPHSFYRTVTIAEESIEVQVDLLAGQYGGTGKNREHQGAQEVKFRKARGSDLVFEPDKRDHARLPVVIEGVLPSGDKDSVKLYVASVPAFIIMKGFALGERLKEKDADDIYYCLLNHPGGIEALVGGFQPFLDHGLTKEALKIISEKFSSVDQYGPGCIATFRELTDPDEIARVKRDAFERVQEFLKGVGFEATNGNRA